LDQLIRLPAAQDRAGQHSTVHCRIESIKSYVSSFFVFHIALNEPHTIISS
jgi:hypothetical protein